MCLIALSYALRQMLDPLCLLALPLHCKHRQSKGIDQLSMGFLTAILQPCCRLATDALLTAHMCWRRETLVSL